MPEQEFEYKAALEENKNQTGNGEMIYFQRHH